MTSYYQVTPINNSHSTSIAIETLVEGPGLTTTDLGLGGHLPIQFYGQWL